MSAYRGVLGNSALVRLFAGEFISGIGDWLYLVALLVIVYNESQDPLLLGIVGAARIIPYVILSVPAGIIIDRFDRRLVLLVTDVARGLIMVALTIIVANDGPLIAVVGLAIFATCFSCFFRPAIGAYLPSLVRDERELGPANSLFATLGELSFIIGPALAGIIIAASDLTLAFAINAVTFAIVAITLATLPPGLPGKPSGGVNPAVEGDADAPMDGSVPAAVADGALPEALATAATPVVDDIGARARIMAIRRPLLGMLALDTTAGFLFGGLSVLTVIIAVDQLHAGEAGTGYLNAAVGVGGVLGALVSGAILARKSLAPAMLGGALVLAAGFVILGLSTSLPPALFAMAIIAAGSLVADIVSTTVFQRIVPDAIRGRVLGGMQSIQTGTYAAGSLLLPVLVTVVGPQLMLPIGGVIILVAALISFSILRPYLTREDDAAVDALTRVSRLPLFAGVPGPALEAAAGRLVPVSVKAGEVVVRQGDPADLFYIIGTGRFAVDQAEPGIGATHRLRVMGPDEVFGELGLMNSTPRTATVTAETDGTLLGLPGPAFLELVGSASSLSGRLTDRYRGAGTAAS
ncbi:MAG TPA: MFS transporter [Candidatus Limnocylindrales bacterium]